MRKFINLSLATMLTIGMTLSLTGSVKAATATVDLKTAASFAILAGTEITNVPTSIITGNVGLSPAAGSFIGLTQAQVTGTMYAVDASGPAGTAGTPSDKTLVDNAKLDLTTAYTDAANRTPVTIVPSELGGQHLYSGVYASSDTKFGITAGAGPLVLDAQNDPNAVFIFEGSFDATPALTVGPGSIVSLINGASACNVFWRVVAATIDTTAVFKGNILAYTSITVATGANIEGRLLAQIGNVTLDHTTVSVPICAATSTSTSTTALPDTGSTSTENSMIWYILMPAVGIIMLVTFLFVIKKKKEI